MTVVGSAWVEIKAIADKFGPSITSAVTEPLKAAGIAATDVGAKAESAAGKAGEAYRGAGKAAQDAANTAATAQGDIATKADASSAQAMKSYASAGAAGKQAAADAAAAQDAVGVRAQGAATQAGGAYQQVSDQAKRAGQDAASAQDDVGDHGQTAGRQASAAYQQAAQDAQQAGKDAASAQDNIASEAQTAAGKAQDAYKSLGDTAKSVGKDAGDAQKDAGDKGEEAAGRAHKVWTALQEVMHHVGSDAKSGVGMVGDAFENVGHRGMHVLDELGRELRGLPPEGKAVGEAVADGMDKAEHKGQEASRKIGQSWKDLFQTVGGAGQGFLSPLMEVQDKFEGIGEHMKGRPAEKIAGIGLAATGAAGALTALGDQEKTAFGQLQQSVQNAGGSWEDLEGQFEKTAKSGEHFGYSTAQSAQALQTLTDTTHDPKAALEAYQATVNLAAAKHMDLQRASMLVSRAMSGQTMALRRYGIEIPKASNDTKELAKVQAAHEKALTASQAAQNAYTMALDRFRAKAHPTQADVDALNISHQKLDAAQKNVTDSSTALSAAQKAAATSGNQQQLALDAITKQMGGQSSVAANTFTGTMKRLRVEVEDHVAEFGQKYGPTMLKVAPAIAGVGTTMTTVGSIMEKWRGRQEAARKAVEDLKVAQEAQKAATEAQTLATEAQSAATEASTAAETLNETAKAGEAAADATAAVGEGALAAVTDVEAASEGAAAAAGAAMDVALGPILAIGAGIVALGVGVYEAYEHFGPFRDIINDIGHFFKTAFIDTIHAVEVAFHAIVGFFTGIFNWMKDFFGKWGHVILDVLFPFIGIPLEIWHHFSAIKGFLVRVWNDVWQFLKTWGPVALSVVMPFIGIPLLIWQHFKQIVGWLGDVWKDVKKGFSDAIGWIRDDVWNPFWDNVIKPVENVAKAIPQALGKVWDGIKTFFGTGINEVAYIINMLTHGLSDVWSWTGLDPIPEIPHFQQYPYGFQKGGWVPGNGEGDVIPAMLEPNEFVLSRKHVALIESLMGPGFLNSLPKFADGGWVPGGPINNKDALFSAIDYLNKHPDDNADRASLIQFVQAHQGGGIFDDIGGAISSAAGDVASGVATGAKAVYHGARTLGAQAVSGMLDAAEAPIKALFHMLPSPIDHIPSKFMDKMHNWIYNKVKGSHDEGGWLPPGGIATNATANPEAVLTGQQWQSISDALRLVNADVTTGEKATGTTFRNVGVELLRLDATIHGMNLAFGKNGAALLSAMDTSGKALLAVGASTTRAVQAAGTASAQQGAAVQHSVTIFAALNAAVGALVNATKATADAQMNAARMAAVAADASAASGPLMHVQGDLVVRNDSDITAINRNLYVAQQNIKRGTGRVYAE